MTGSTSKYFEVCYEHSAIPDAVAVLPKRYERLVEAEQALKNIEAIHGKEDSTFFIRRVTVVVTYDRINKKKKN